MGLVVAGDDQQAAGALVEAVDDPGPLGLPTAARSPPARRPGSRPCARAPGGRPARRACRPRPGPRRGGRSAARPRPSRPLRAASERSTSSSSSSTPTVIATSARLKVGQSGRSMKSVTAPARTRSARLPSAPPTSSAAGSQTSQPLPPRKARKTRKPEQQDDRHTDEHRRDVAAEAEGDPLVADVLDGQEGQDLDPVAAGDERGRERLRALVERDDHAPQAASSRNQESSVRPLTRRSAIRPRARR